MLIESKACSDKRMLFSSYLQASPGMIHSHTIVLHGLGIVVSPEFFFNPSFY